MVSAYGQNVGSQITPSKFRPIFKFVSQIIADFLIRTWQLIHMFHLFCFGTVAEHINNKRPIGLKGRLSIKGDSFTWKCQNGSYLQLLQNNQYG